jgi:hypothetical protein
VVALWPEQVMTTGELGRVVSSVKHGKSDRPKLQKSTIKSQPSVDTTTTSSESNQNNMKSLESMMAEQNTDIDALLQENLEEDDRTLDRHLLEAQLLKKIAARKRVKKQEQSESNSSIPHHPSTASQSLPESVVVPSNSQQSCTARSDSSIQEPSVENDPPNT